MTKEELKELQEAANSLIETLRPYSDSIIVSHLTFRQADTLRTIVNELKFVSNSVDKEIVRRCEIVKK